MNILTSIRSFLEKDFGSFFCDFKAYDHCENKFQNAQVVLTIGSISNGTFLPLEMLFSNVKDNIFRTAIDEK